MYSTHKLLPIMICFLVCSLLPSCQESQNKQESNPPEHTDTDFTQVFVSLHNSCMPCHNHSTLPGVIERVKQASFQEIDGETRLRILAELEELKILMDQGLPLSFLSKEHLHRSYEAIPGGFYTMLEKGVMPPPWAPELMQAINWPHYTPLTFEKRVELLKYAKPHSKKYLR